MMQLRHATTGALLALPLALGGCQDDPGGDHAETTATVLALQARDCGPIQPIRIGVLLDDASPARDDFALAADLAESRINEGLARARSPFRAEVIPGAFGGSTGHTQATRTIELVNVAGVVGVVSDVSGVPAGPGGTVAVNRLNYETPPRIAHPVPVTCYQCSSAFFNDPAQADPGFADPAHWLWRTFIHAAFESAMQVQLVLDRPGGGDFDGDGHLKIAVYHDAAHLSAATTMPGLLDQLAQGPHSVELIAKTLPSTPATRAAELARLFDGHNDTTGADDGRPDSVYLAFLPQNVSEALADFTTHPVPARPPATANNGARRDFLLPALLASGGEGLEGNSVQLVARSASGEAFLAAFQQASGGAPPELTASFVHDAVAAQVLAGLIAAEAGGLTPENLREALGQLSDPAGRTIEATPAGFARAARRIRAGRPINYDGAASPLDLTAPEGEMFPELTHWRIEGGRFVELATYRCDPSAPLCERQP
jgi:hypothetical protein